MSLNRPDHDMSLSTFPRAGFSGRSRYLLRNLRGQNVRLSHIDIPFADFDSSVDYLSSVAGHIDATFVTDDTKEKLG